MSNLFLHSDVVRLLYFSTLFLMSSVYCVLDLFNVINRNTFKFVICTCGFVGAFYVGTFITLFQILNLN